MLNFLLQNKPNIISNEVVNPIITSCYIVYSFSRLCVVSGGCNFVHLDTWIRAYNVGYLWTIDDKLLNCSYLVEWLLEFQVWWSPQKIPPGIRRSPWRLPWHMSSTTAAKSDRERSTGDAAHKQQQQQHMSDQERAMQYLPYNQHQHSNPVTIINTALIWHANYFTHNDSLTAIILKETISIITVRYVYTSVWPATGTLWHW